MSNIKSRLIVLFCIVIFGCNNDDGFNTKDIIGTWQLIEIYSDPGDGSGQWYIVENGYQYIFYPFNQFTSNRFSDCENGMYSLNSNQLILDFECDGFTTGIESPQGIFIEEYTIESNNMILIPTYLNCTEGCGWKFKKIG